MPLKVAIVGSGISGLAAAHTLLGKAEISLLEANSYFGGHTHTVDISLPTATGVVTQGVDTGFLVFNERTYPNLIAMLGELEVKTTQSDMSFSVQALDYINHTELEWSGNSLNTVFSQRANLVKPRFWQMLRDMLRFNAHTTQLAQNGTAAELSQSLEDFLEENKFSRAFCDWYFLPMMACIWSCPTAQMLKFPVSTMVRFCHNHGLLQINNRPQWWTVYGGAKHYVEKITATIADKRLNTKVKRIEHLTTLKSGKNAVQITSDSGVEVFDKVIIATHSDQALGILADPTFQEREILGAIQYQLNDAVLHTDESVMPSRKTAWAAWNYENKQAQGSARTHVCLHYWLNRLQPLPWEQPVIVTLNPVRVIEREKILGEYRYAHPVFDLAAVAAQARIPMLQGQHNRYYAGAWMGYGFHEDGLKAGVAAAERLLADVNNTNLTQKAAA